MEKGKYQVQAIVQHPCLVCNEQAAILWCPDNSFLCGIEAGSHGNCLDGTGRHLQYWGWKLARLLKAELLLCVVFRHLRLGQSCSKVSSCEARRFALLVGNCPWRTFGCNDKAHGL